MNLIAKDLGTKYAPPLLRWFDRCQRKLPWREQKSAYRIWVSEIMLQQTQVKTVIPYFERFLKAFPSVEHLAMAKEQEVLKLWEGLGYYRRARQLHAAAKEIVEQHQAVFPSDFATVLGLPGIGRYTAGAILSIAFDQRQPILEGNTQRVYSRLLALRSDPRLTANQKRLWEFAASILPKKRVGDFNQALMELGSEICTPQSPNCIQCPVANLCQAKIRGVQHQIPVRGKKTDYQSIEEAVCLVQRRGRYLVRRCQSHERWAGLWDFPRFQFNRGSDHLRDLESQLQASSGLKTSLLETDLQIRHAVTRFRILLTCFRASKVQGRLKSSLGADGQPQLCWASRDELDRFPMSVTGRKLVARLP